MARKPIVAGQFNEGDFGALDKQINDCFESKFGPGALPLGKREKNVLGMKIKRIENWDEFEEKYLSRDEVIQQLADQD